MRNRLLGKITSACAIVVAFVTTQPAISQQTHADMILENAAIYTMDGARSWAQAMAVANGKIVAVGSGYDMNRFAGPLTKIVDLEGKMILPAFHDSHIHPLTSEIEETLCNLHELVTREQVIKTIQTYADEHKDAEWILGGGWALPIFPAAGPTRQELDALVGTKPAYLESGDAHSAWVNSIALQKASITKDTPDPPNGRIERDAVTGEPTGVLREEAMELVAKLTPKPTLNQYREAALSVQKKLNEVGITSVVDAAVDESMLKTYADLAENNLLTMRVVGSIKADPDKGLEQIAQYVKWREKYSNSLFKATAIKIFTDGVIETKTASLLEPYIGEPKTSGILNWKEDDLNKFVTTADGRGFQIHFHSIGDRAVRVALNSLAWAAATNRRTDRRHQIAHLELIHPEDIVRFRELNVTANFQPYWAYLDKYVTDLTVPVLGEERCKRLYQLGTVYATGASMVAGSDWSVTTNNPLEAIQVAVTRIGPDQTDAKPFLPEERVALPQILAMYTIAGAYLCRNERETGSIEIGKSADIIILDQNLFAIPPSEIRKAKVLVTYFRGREVWRHPSYTN